MRKIVSLLLVFMLVLSVVTMPASAKDAMVDDPVKTVDIDALDASVNYLTDSTKIKDTNLTLTHSSGNVGLYTTSSKNWFGVVDLTSEDKTITKYLLCNATGKETIQDAYAMGENYDLIVGNAMGATYNGTDANTTGRIIKGQPMKGAYLKKVADPENANNNVLEFNYGQTGETKPTTSYQGVINRLVFGSKEVMYSASAPAKSSMMAYEWSVYVPENSAKYLTSSSSAYITLGGIYTDTSTGTHLLKDTTVYTSKGKLMYKVYDISQSMHTEFEITPDAWHTFKYVVIIDEETMNSEGELYGYPMVAVFFDGKLVCKVRSYTTLKDAKCGVLRLALAPFAASKYADQTKNFNVYYDDIKQYWVDDQLKISGVKDFYDGFNPAKDSVEVVYSNDADFGALEDAITVKHNGEVAEDVSVSIEKKNDNTAVIKFLGMDTTEATTYNVEIAGFKDVYGNTISETKSFAVTTYQAGKLNVTKSEANVDYEIGTHKAIALTTDAKADISNVKFYIKDKDGEIVKELTPSVNEEGTVFVFDLFGAGLNSTGEYTFVTEGVFKEAEGERINSEVIEIPVIAVNYDYEGTYIINDNFDGEGIVKDTNWLTNSKAAPTGWKTKWMHLNYDNTKSGSFAENASGTHVICACSRCVSLGQTEPENILAGSYVAVVSDPKDASNNVVKYMAGKNGDGTHMFRVYNRKDNVIIDPTKNVVMSAKILLTDSMKNNMANYKYNDIPGLATRANMEDNFIGAQCKTNANGDLILTASNGFSTTLKTDEWFELKYVAMPTTTKVETRDDAGNLTAVTYDVWTFMVYINDVLIGVNSKTVFNGSNTSITKNGITYKGGFVTTDNTGYNVYGTYFGLYPENNGDVQPTFYVDDVKVYQPDNFEADAVLSGSTVTIASNHVLAKDVLSTMKIKGRNDADVDVITSKTISTDKKTITIVLNEEMVDVSTEYKVTGLYDGMGQMLKTDLTFTTPKSFSIYVESASITDTSADGKLKANVKFVNSTGKSAPALLVIAVHGNINETLGVKAVSIPEFTSEWEGELEVSYKGNASDVKEVKVYLWDSVRSMLPYQGAESIQL